MYEKCNEEKYEQINNKKMLRYILESIVSVQDVHTVYGQTMTDSAVPYRAIGGRWCRDSLCTASV